MFTKDKSILRKVLTVLAALIVMSMLFSRVLASIPQDVAEHWAKEDLLAWVDTGWLTGYPDGTIRPDRQVSRAEFIVLVDRAFSPGPQPEDPGFTDVSESDWYYEYISNAADLLTGRPDGSFGPGDPITRQEAAVVINRLLELEPSTADPFTDQPEVAAWAKEAVLALREATIITGYEDGTFRPAQPLTRAQAVTTLNRALEKTEDYTVTFEVKDETGNPVADARITVGDKTARSGEEGIVTFRFRTGEYRYEVTREGYHPVEGYVELEHDDIIFPVVLGEKAKALVSAGITPLCCIRPDDVRLWVTLEKGMDTGQSLTIDFSEPAARGIDFGGDVKDMVVFPAGTLTPEPALPGEGPVISYEPHSTLGDGSTVMLVLDGDLLDCGTAPAWEGPPPWETSPHAVPIERTDSDARITARWDILREDTPRVTVDILPYLQLAAGETQRIGYTTDPEGAEVAATTSYAHIADVETIPEGLKIRAGRPGTAVISLQGIHDEYEDTTSVVFVTVE